MEYQKHKCRGSVCECFQKNKISLEKVMLKISKSKKATRHHRVFATCMAKRFGTWMKRLSVFNLQEKWAEQLTNAAPRTGPPPKRSTFRIFHKIIDEHQIVSRFLKFPTVHGVRGVINAPPSVIKAREYVHEFIQRENQTESIAV